LVGSPDSSFARELESALGSKCGFAEPFCWTGNNYESDRRKAARQLFDRLSKEDEAGHRYHLIGRSHGGSIIWHTLVASVGIWKKPLTGLVSWTTVGTPFLTFTPDYGAWWLPVSTAAAIVGCTAAAFVLWEPLRERDAILNDANNFALIGTLQQSEPIERPQATEMERHRPGAAPRESQSDFGRDRFFHPKLNRAHGEWPP
jgi:hypothetical protein